MDKPDLNTFSKEQIAMAAKCNTPEELMDLAKKNSIELTKEQAEAYLAELENVELDEAALDKVAGGQGCYSLAPQRYCGSKATQPLHIV